MTRKTHRVTFQPEGRSVFVLQGAKLVEAAGQAGIILNQPCGGEGTCGKCAVEVLEDAPEPTDADRRHLSKQELADGWRLACQLAIDADLVVSVPQAARFFEQVILVEREGIEGVEGPRYPFRPNVRKRLVVVPEPTVEDQRSDLDRLTDAVAAAEAAAAAGAAVAQEASAEAPDAPLDADTPLTAGLPLVRALPGLLREGGPTVTAVLEGNEIQWVESGDTTGRLWGLALDIGTTSVVGALMNLADGTTAAVASRTNPQVHFGDDVVSRISYIEQNSGGLDKLRRRLLACLNEIIAELCDAAGAEPEAIYEAAAVGNTTMSHIFLGVDPGPIAHAPYVAVFRESMDVKAREVGLEVNRDANLHMLPNIAGFVGSDTVAVILASGMAQDAEVQVAIDIGTNGEVVIGNRDRLVACSCAAGPAFEGARIRFGMRATEGAVSKVVVNDDIETSVIGGGLATGICGSGLIDAVAGLLEAGIIDPTVRILAAADAAGPPDAVREAVTECDGQPAVVLVPGARTKSGRPVLLTQRDVREVQLAKAAIHAGVAVIAGEFGMAPQEVPRVLLAGGFGNFIRRSMAKRIGLLPDLPTERIDFIGNAAATGAKTVLTCRDCRSEARRISRRTEYVELANRADFQMHYMEAMTFPSG